MASRGNGRSPAAACLLVLGLVLLLSPPAAAARCPSNFCRCMQGCNSGGKTLEDCAVRCVLPQMKEIAAVPLTSSSSSSAPNSIDWVDFCKCVCGCIVRCTGRGRSLKLCAAFCVGECAIFTTAGEQQDVGSSTA